MCININEIAGIVLVQPVTTLGVEEKILKATAVNNTYVAGRINAVDSSARWTFLKSFATSAYARAEPKKEALSNGIELNVTDAPKTFTGVIPATTPQYIREFESIKCLPMAFYGVDIKGNLIGRRDAKRTAIFPFLIAAGTINLQERQATGGNLTTGVKVDFTLDMSEKDSDTDAIESSEMENVNMLTLISTQRTYNVETALFASTTTGFTVDLATVFGSNKNPSPVIGFETFLKVQRVSTGLDVPISPPTPNATIKGRYAVTFVTPLTIGDKIRLYGILPAVVSPSGGSPAFILTSSILTEITI